LEILPHLAFSREPLAFKKAKVLDAMRLMAKG
jgi:hypothetical protein